jgi:gliding motility-associated-like protein
MRIIVVFCIIITSLFSYAKEPKVDKLIQENSLSFIENKGQWDNRFQMMAEIPGGTFFAEKNALRFKFYDQTQFGKANKDHLHTKYHFLENKLNWQSYLMTFVGANEFNWQGGKKTEGYSNYFIGKDSTTWASYVYSYSSITAQEVYEGVQMKMYSQNNNFKYDFIVAPGINTDVIKWQYDGVDNVKLRHGEIRINTSLNQIVELKPIAYQIIEGEKQEVACEFVENNGEFGFNFPEGYHTGISLVIDPVLVFSTFSGSYADNFGFTATYDRDGFLYSGSIAFGLGYATTVGAYQTTYEGGTIDIAITKYDTTGTKRIYSTYIGGSGNESPSSLVVNSNDELYILGLSGSNNYPTSEGAFDTTYSPGGGVGPGSGYEFSNGSDIIITQLNNTGSKILSSTYIGGQDLDGINTSFFLTPNYADEFRGEIILDKEEKVYIATCTKSSDMPIKFTTTFVGDINGADKLNGLQDGYIAKLDENLSTIFWSRYVGGSGFDGIYSLDVSDSSVFCAGGTTSPDFYTTDSAYQDTLSITSACGIVLKYDKYNGNLLASTLYGKADKYSQAYMTKIDNRGYVYLFGQIDSAGADFNVNTGFGNDNGEMYISTLSNDLTERIWSTTFGGLEGDPRLSPSAFSVGVCAKIFLSAWGDVRNYPTSPDAYKTNTNSSDFYIMLLDIDATELVYGTYFGGDATYDHVDGGTSRFDKHGLIYQSVCGGCGANGTFPIFPPDAVSPTNNNANCNNAVFKIDFEFEYVFADFEAPNACFLDSLTFINKSRLGDEYLWDFGDGTTSTDSAPTHYYSTPGLYTVSLIATNTGICNNADEFSKQVLILGGENGILPKKQVCYGSDIQIGLSKLGGNYLTTWSPSYGLSNTEVSNPIASIDSSMTYQLLIDNGVCIDTFYQEVEVLHFDFEVPDKIVFCEPTINVLISATRKDSLSQLTWSRNIDLSPTITPSTDSSILIQVLFDQIIYVQGNNQGCLQTKSIPIFIDSIGVNLPENVILCEDESFEITAEGTGGHSNVYRTKIPQLGVDEYQFSSYTFIPPFFGWYQVIVSDSISGCSTLDSILVSFVEDIYALPTGIIKCEFDTINLVATLNNSITNGIASWGPRDKILGSLSGELALIAPTVPTEYWLTTYGTYIGCTSADTILVDVSAPMISLSDDVEICFGDTVIIKATNASTDGSLLSFKWKYNETILNPDTLAEISVSPKESTYYVVTGVNQFGCEVTDSVLVSFADLGVEVSPDIFICLGDTINLIAQIVSGLDVTLEWSPVSEIIDGISSDDTITVSPENSTFFSLVAEVAGTCKSSYGVQVVVNNDQLFPSNDIVLCIGDTATLSLNNKFPQFKPSINWQPSSEIIGGNTSLFIDVSPNQDTYYTYLATYDARCPVLDSILVEVSDIQISLPPYARFCENGMVTVTATNLDVTQVITYLWSTASEIVSPNNEASVVLKPSGDTTLHLVINNQFGCQEEFDVPIYISLPDFEVTNDTILCLNEVMYLKAFNTNVLDTFLYAWTGADLIMPVDKDSVSLNPKQSQYVHVSGVNQIGCEKTDSVLVVIAPDQIQLPPPTSICQYDSIWIKVSALYEQLPVDYQWSGPKIIREEGDSILVNPDTSATYNVSVVTSDNCTYTEAYELNVIVIHVDISADVLICDGTATTLQITNQAPIDLLTHEWLPNLGGDNTQADYQVSPDTSTVFVVQSENSIGCKRKDSVLVALASEYTYAIPNTTICFGDTISVQAINRYPQFSADYEWSFSHNDLNVLGGLNNDTVVIVPDTSLSVYLTTTTGLGCNPLDSVYIDVSKIILDITDSLVICKSDTSVVFVHNLLADKVFYNWTYAGQIVGNSDNDSLNFVAETDGVIYLETSNDLGCQRFDEIPFSVTFVEFTGGENLLLCPGDSGELMVENANPNHILTYKWTPSEGIISDDEMNEITVQPDSTTTYTVFMQNQHGCTLAETAVAVLTNDMLQITPDTIICAFDIATLSAINLFPEFSVTYQWTPVSDILTLPSMASIDISLDKDVTYVVEVNNELGCLLTDSIKVHVSALSLLSFTGFTTNDSIPYNGTTQVYVEPYIDAYQYHWEPANEAAYPDSFLTNVTLQQSTVMRGAVTDSYCIQNFSVSIYVNELICDEPNIFLPNGFTPNGDGENDVLLLRGNNLEAITLKVYDRWGAMVFETQDQQMGWDGTYKGKKLDPAVFVYHLNVQCENNLSYFKKGNVTLIR